METPPVAPASMWTDCSQVLDIPVKKWGFEWEDLMLVGSISIGAMFVLPPLYWVGATVGLFVGVWYGKRGKPPGAIQHWLHQYELWLVQPNFSLPGCIPARRQTYLGG